MKIKIRLQVSVILTAVLVITVGSFLFISVQSVNDHNKKARITSEIVKGMAGINIVMHEYLLNPGERSFIQWQTGYDSLIKTITGGEFKRSREKIVINEILKNLERVKAVFTDVVRSCEYVKGFGVSKNTLPIELQDRLIGELLVKSQSTVFHVFQIEQIIHEELNTAQQRSSLLIIIFLVILTVLITAISLWINASIGTPLTKLQKGTQIIGSGNLDHKVSIAAADEIGQLSRAFDKMTEDLKGTTTSIDDLIKEIAMRKRIEKALQKARDELEQRVEARTVELKKTNEQLREEIEDRKRAEEDLEKHRGHLEEIVRQRTTELDNRVLEVEQLNRAMLNLLEDLRAINEILELRTRQLTEVNQDLDAFAYSVSHDLRAPLRAIDGFSKILVEDHEDKLDADGKRQLNVIQDSARDMGQLIDDLLRFSRLGRKGMSVSEINMGELVEEVFKQHRHGADGREARLIVQTLPPAVGDRALIREVLSNLLTNALKYRESNKNVLVEVGGRVEGDEDVYYVKDNGVGFDMKYADKLFHVFQRLHGADEFDGTGIGLALVQRIIHRHGGRVWAEGKVGGGATFYFSLPRSRFQI